MGWSKETTVEVTYEGPGKITCEPEWVECYWKVAGREDIHWIFKGFPEHIKSAEVRFLEKVPTKYTQGVPNFVTGPFGGVRKIEGTGIKGLAELETFDNLKKQGYFCYTLEFFDASNNKVDECDPGGTNDPDPPPSPHP